MPQNNSEQTNIISSTGTDTMDDFTEASDAKIHNSELRLQETHVSTAASELPSDILLIFFFMLRDTYTNYRKKLWDWLSVTKVCRHWRSVALDCASLWTVIQDSRHLDKIQAFLERSGQTELDVNLIFCGFFSYKFTSMLEGHMWRVRELKITLAESGFIVNTVKARLLEMTRCTKTLELRNKRNAVRGARHPGIITNLPDVFPAVQLDSLTLESVALPWSNSLYRNLLELDISDEAGAIHKPNIWQFINIIMGCPNLQCLKIKRFMPSYEEADIFEIQNRGKKLHLLCLNSIVLADASPKDCSTFFEIFSISKSVSLDISLFNSPVLSPILPSHVMASRKDCKSMTIDLDGNNFKLQSDAVWEDKEIYTNSISTIAAKLRTTFDMENQMQLIGALLKYPFWQMVDTIAISFGPDFQKFGHYYRMRGFTWNILLNGLPKSTRILSIKFLNSHSVSDLSFLFDELPTALSARTVRNTTEERFRVPELEEITIQDVEIPIQVGKEAYEILQETIDNRNELARKTCKIHFLNCSGFN